MGLIHSKVSLGCGFWRFQTFLAQKNGIDPVNSMNFLMGKLARFLAAAFCVVSPLKYGLKWSKMLENCQEPIACIVCIHEKNKMLIISTLHERISARKSHLNMIIKSKSQTNGSHLFEAVTHLLSIESLSLSFSNLNL